jgi:NAD-dependent dihydropyrimidine dehydrogenase PreA subunit
MSIPRAIISRSPDGGHGRRGFEDAVAARLAGAGVRVLVVPHVYHLAADHAAVGLLADLRGPSVLGAWLNPRASRWVVSALGVPEAPMASWDFGASASPEECAEAMLGELGGPAGEQASIEDVSGAVAERWYPVVDYSRCTGCGQCLDFCLFGVYSREGDRVVASSPDNCKPGCPACARVCPSAAIMFPHYADDPAIAGADRQPAGEAPAGGTAESQPAAGQSSDEDLADLLTALDEFDE